MQLPAISSFHRAVAPGLAESSEPDAVHCGQYCSLVFTLVQMLLPARPKIRVMPTKKKARAKPLVVVAAVVRPVSMRLGRIEDLLIEMRGVLDLHLKRIAALQRQVDMLMENELEPSIRRSAASR
jgi:hypothetical protein